MIMWKTVVVGIAIFLISQITAAGEVELSKEFSSCMDSSGGVTVDMLNCIGAETSLQDKRLNNNYKKLMIQLSPERKKELQEVQRAWIKYRDANCNFYADPDGGTMATVSSSDCFMSSTAARAKELENFMQ